MNDGSGQNATILLVDDQPDVLTTISLFLSKVGYDVVTADSVQAASVELLRPDSTVMAVITDIHMPSGSGIGLLDLAQTLDSPPPIIILTAYADLDTAVAGIRKQAFDYLTKPPDFGRLRHVVEQAVRYRRLSLLELRYTQELKEEVQRKTTELENQQLRLKDLAADLCRVEEMERRRISTQLHDQIGQTLIFTKIKLARLAQEIRPDLAADLRDALAALDSAIKGVRTLTVQVSPPLLYEVGLEAALDELGESISTEHGLKVTLRTGEAQLALSGDERIVLYQSVRELLVNVVKHSGSRTVRVTFFTEDGQRCVQVADEGCGFDVAASERRGFGLFNIRERIKRLGGDCTIESSPHHGTIVTLRLPGISH